MTSAWPSKAFWDELAGKELVLSIPDDETICLQCGAQIGKAEVVCPHCGGDPGAPIPLDFSDFEDDDWERL